MSLKTLLIIFLVVALAPVFMGKVAFPSLSDFFKSWDSFKLSSKKLLADDYNYYKSLVTPWIGVLIDMIKGKIKASI